MQQLSGIFCAFWTPVDQRGEVIWPAFEHNLEFVIKSGADGIMALGSTAEFPHLHLAQRKEILERLVATKLPTIANVSDISHHKATELALHAKEAGAKAIALLPPWFFPMAQRELAQFFITVAKASGMPLVLYNYTEMTGKKIEPETIRAVASAVRVIGFKQSGADFGYHPELVQLGKQYNFPVMTGSDTRLEEALRLGCTGTISGLSNATTPILRRVFDQFQKGQSSPRDNEFLAKLSSLLGTLEVPLNVKAVLEARGLQTGEFKNPVSEETLRHYVKLRDQLKELFATVG